MTVHRSDNIWKVALAAAIAFALVLLMSRVAPARAAQVFTCTAEQPIGTQAFTLTCTSSQPNVPPVVTPPVVIAPVTTSPPSASCAEGMGGGDLVWSSLHAVQLWPIPAVTGSGESGRAIQFVADATKYPRGVQLVGADENQSGLGPKDYVVSECPHNFNPVGGKASCTAIGAGSYAGPLYLRFGPAQPGTQSYDCPLNAGGTYYINFRDYYPARGTVSSQFVIYGRGD